MLDVEQQRLFRGYDDRVPPTANMANREPVRPQNKQINGMSLRVRVHVGGVVFAVTVSSREAKVNFFNTLLPLPESGCNRGL